MVERLVSSKLVPGVHFCTLNLEKSVRTVLENLNWTSLESNSRKASPLLRHNKLIEEDSTDYPISEGMGGLSINHGKDTKSQVSGLSISPSEASQLAQWGLTNSALPPAPKKGLGNAAVPSTNGAATAEDSWDEYPNGRFTDVRSPAYGEIDGWGSGLKTTVRST